MESNCQSDSINCFLKNKLHFHSQFSYQRPKIYNNILQTIGNTPMVKLNRIPQEQNIQCQIYAKCQFLNPGGSLKDRIGYKMILDAQLAGIVKKGDKLVEPTSGNTGIGLTLASVVKGYQITITIPEKMSDQKVNVIKCLGGKIIRTPTQASFDSPESNLEMAYQMHRNGQAICIDQYKNISNTLVHYDQTAEEILHQMDNKIDAIIIGVGTGGTLCGIGKKIKQKLPSCLIIGVDPHGSILAQPQTLNSKIIPYKVQGIGHDFIPQVLDRSVVDRWYKVQDKESFIYARKLINKQGMFCGGSSGSILSVALRFIREEQWGKQKRVVIILADNIRNYLSKMVSKEWCVQNRFLPYEELREPGHRFENIPLSKLNLKKLKSYEQLTIQEAKEIFKSGAKCIPIKKDGLVNSVIFQPRFFNTLLLRNLKSKDDAILTASKDFVTINNDLDCSIAIKYQILIELYNVIQQCWYNLKMDFQK